jgi:hypothetical protein
MVLVPYSEYLNTLDTHRSTSGGASTRVLSTRTRGSSRYLCDDVQYSTEYSYSRSRVLVLYYGVEYSSYHILLRVIQMDPVFRLSLYIRRAGTYIDTKDI